MPDIPWEIVLASIGVLVTAGAFLWEFLFIGRKRLGYRVQMDTTPTAVSPLHAGAWRRLEREDSTPLVDPSFVLVRIENIGATKIDEADYAVPADDPVGIRVRFPGRKVAGIVPTELSDPNMATFFDPNENATGFGMGQDEASPSIGVVKLPKVKLNRSAHYKVLVVLDEYPLLLPRPIAFPLFTIVVNPEAGVQDLSLEQIRQIYDGRITNWAQVNGNDIPVRLVGRPGDSGTRRTFENRILGGRWEPVRNSDDCESVGSGAPPGVIRCERPTTDDVLNAVAETPGALGYGELEAASGRDGLLLLRIDGQAATLEAADHGAYPFWETEYAYTYGDPAAQSLAASFLRYLTNEVGRDIIRAHGQRPCSELANPVLCHPS